MNNIAVRVLTSYPLLYQLFRFGVVGTTAALIHFTVVVILVHGLFIAPLAANVFGYAVAFQMSYWGHRLWTFNGTVSTHREALPKLVIVQSLNFAANQTLFYFLLTLHLPYQLALLITLAVLPMFTFVLNKLWVFR